MKKFNKKNYLTILMLSSVILCACNAETTIPEASTAAVETTSAETESTTESLKEEKSTETTSTEENSTETTSAEKDGQNPVMNLVGPYKDENGSSMTMTVSCLNDDEASIEIVSFGDENYKWILTGSMHSDDESNNGYITYENASKIKEIPADDSKDSVAGEEVVYENGKGRFTINDDWSISWQDENEDAGKDVKFTFDSESSTGFANMSNPIVERENLKDAEQAVGFDFNSVDIEELPDKYYITIGDETIQEFNNSKNYGEAEGIYIRKGRGHQDISGDYNEYAVIDQVDVDGKTVTMKGFEKDQYNLAIWIDGDYSYSIFGDGFLLTEEDIKKYATEIN